MNIIYRKLFQKYFSGPEPRFVVCEDEKAFREICKRYWWNLNLSSFISIDDFNAQPREVQMKLIGRRAEYIWHSDYCEKATDRMPQREYDAIYYGKLRERIMKRNGWTEEDYATD